MCVCAGEILGCLRPASASGVRREWGSGSGAGGALGTQRCFALLFHVCLRLFIVKKRQKILESISFESFKFQAIKDY